MDKACPVLIFKYVSDLESFAVPAFLPIYLVNVLFTLKQSIKKDDFYLILNTEVYCKIAEP